MSNSILPLIAESASRIPIYVTPFYDSEGPLIQIGEYSEALQSDDIELVIKTIDNMKANWDGLTVVAMYVAAIRLYDLGEKDEAVFWFYAAQHRGKLFQLLLDQTAVGSIGDPAFELGHAHDSFAQLAGKFINGYAFCDLNKYVVIVNQALSKSSSVPPFQTIYPYIKFDNNADWDAGREMVSDGLAGLISYVNENGDQIREERELNGMDEKFCN